MPIYEFACARCGAKAEVFQRSMTAEVAAPACPRAGGEAGHQMRRAISRFARHLDMQTKLAEAEATWGKEVDAAMGPEPDVGRLARRYETLAKDLPPPEGPP